MTWQDYLEKIPEEYHQKYDRMGIYSITIDDELVYIGKSENMLKRLCNHLFGIDGGRGNKYAVLRQAIQEGHKISFDVMETCQDTEELGEREGVLIRAYLPPLNYQIPKETNWRSYTVNKKAKYITLLEILNPITKWERFDF